MTLEEFLQVAVSPKGPLISDLSSALPLKTIGPLPLSRMTDLTDSEIDVPFDSGEIFVELINMSVAPLRTLTVEHKNIRNVPFLKITLAPMVITGGYRLFTVEQPRVNIDTGGNLMPLFIANNDLPPITPEQFAQLQTARSQRSKLKTTTNGQALLANYQKYNDDYDNAFQTNVALRTYWAADGVTAQMAQDTSDAVNAGNQVINSSSKKYGTNNLTYNENAFEQQTYLVSALIFSSPDAAQAASTFQNQVNQSTNNTQNNTVEMNASDVYQHVNGSSTTSRKAMEISDYSNHTALVRVAKNEHEDTDLIKLRNSGYHMHERQIQTMQEIYNESVRQNDPKNRAELWHGTISAALPESIFEFSLAEYRDSVIAATLEKKTFSVPDIDIDMAGWKGAAGAIAQKRLASAYFIRGLLRSRIVDYIESTVENCANRYVNGK